jgi:hypothetical protein
MQEIELKLRRLYRQRQALTNLIRAVEEYALVSGVDGQKESVLAMVQPLLLGSAGRKPNGSAAALVELEKISRGNRGVA